MIQTITAPAMTVQEYIQFEWKAELRHEFIDGNLFEMPGEQDINNEIAGDFYSLLKALLRARGFQIYSHDLKVAIPGGQKFYYPDVFITNEAKSPDNLYIKYAPALIIEVVSPSSHKHDYVDKYIDYTQIPSLQYYIIAEPETLLITVNERAGEEWIATKYTRLDESVQLPLLNISLPMTEIYESLRS